MSEKMMKVTAIHTHTYALHQWVGWFVMDSTLAPRLCLLLLQHRSRTCPTLVEGPAFPIISLSLSLYTLTQLAQWLDWEWKSECARLLHSSLTQSQNKKRNPTVCPLYKFLSSFPDMYGFIAGLQCVHYRCHFDFGGRGNSRGINTVHAG